MVPAFVTVNVVVVATGGTGNAVEYGKCVWLRCAFIGIVIATVVPAGVAALNWNDVSPAAEVRIVNGSQAPPEPLTAVPVPSL